MLLGSFENIRIFDEGKNEFAESDKKTKAKEDFFYYIKEPLESEDNLYFIAKF